MHRGPQVAARARAEGGRVVDWSNERYVRLYVRDTVTWLRLEWDGQNVLMQLLRKVDRAGTMELSGLEPWEAVKLAIKAPEDAAKRGVDALLRTGTMVIRGGRLGFPTFLEAQEAQKSDRLRQRESRERRVMKGHDLVVNRDDTSRGVTSGHESNPSVTEHHDRSHDVTIGHSVQGSAVQGSAVQEKTPPAGAPVRGINNTPSEPGERPKQLVTDTLGMSLALGKALDDAGWTDDPVVPNSQLLGAATRAAKLAKRRGIPLEQATALVAAAGVRDALAKRRPLGLALGDAPIESEPPKASGRSHGSSAKDFKGELSLEEQRARAKARREREET